MVAADPLPALVFGHGTVLVERQWDWLGQAWLQLVKVLAASLTKEALFV